MGEQENVEIIRSVFHAIEHRDQSRLFELFHPDVEFHWAPSLPYGRNVRQQPTEGPTWAETWIPLQPTEAERCMDVRVVAASETEVVVLWRQRGVTPAGDRFDGPVLALYLLRDGKLARAQMFDFDGAELVRFLAGTAASGI